MLQNTPSPWGGNNRDLVTLYRNASDGECPLVIDDTTPTCGNSRFGCWVCTVAQRDSSMEAMVDNGEAWLEPLLEFRDHLAATIDPERKREYRDIKGRDGRVIINKEGSAAVARTYKLEASQDMLERLLRAQQAVRRSGPNPNETLIAEEELHEIRRLWRTERQDWEDSVPKIFRQVMGHDLEWPVDDDVHFDTDQKTLLANICNEYDVPFSLVAKMLEAERRAAGMARRASIQKSLDAVLNEEWRSEVEIIKYKREEQLPLP